MSFPAIHEPTPGSAAGVAAGTETAASHGELGVRVLARGLDFLLLTLLATGSGLAVGFGYVWLVVVAASVLAYFAGCDALAGTTLGKAALGLRVVREGGTRPSIGQALVRESFTLFGAIPFVGPVLAVIAWVSISLTIRSHPRRRGIHDRLAGTGVIRVGRSEAGAISPAHP